MATKKTPPSIIKSIYDFPNMLALNDTELPEITSWTVGEQYIVQLKVEQISIRKKEDGSMCAEFKIISAKTEHEEESEEKYAEGGKVETVTKASGPTMTDAKSTKATPTSDKKTIIDRYDMLKKGGMVKKAGGKIEAKVPVGKSGDSSVKSPTSSDVRSPTKTSTSTSTDAYTSGNVTVTGGAGRGATTTVHIAAPEKDPMDKTKSASGASYTKKDEVAKPKSDKRYIDQYDMNS